MLHADRLGVADVVAAARLVLSEAALERVTALAAPPTRAPEAA